MNIEMLLNRPRDEMFPMARPRIGMGFIQNNSAERRIMQSLERDNPMRHNIFNRIFVRREMFGSFRSNRSRSVDTDYGEYRSVRSD